jgi:glycosyltransferase involved in cell wall biosynthesis
MHRLDQRSVSGRSRALRALASSADFIVIHAHPDDAIAAVALCDPYGALPPQVMIDHADHVFWLLPGSPALHVSVRPAARDVAIGLRGVPRDNTAVLPIPVRADGSPRVGTARDRQRAILNIPSSDVLAVTVARSVKYRRSPVHPGFLDTVVPAVERVPNLHVVAIGPSPEEPDWQRALIRTQGRIRALGPLSDPGPYLAAADIYLDSFPFTSHTSMLEAVSHDLPVLAGTRYSGTARLLGAGTLLGGTAISAQSDDDYARTLARLASDPPLRAQVAQASREVLETQHLERAWRDRMEAVLAAADERGAAAVCGVVDRDLEYAEVLRGTESQAPLQWILAAGRRDFDRLDRGRIAWGSWRSRVRRRLARLGPPSGVEDAHHFVQGTRKADTDQLSTQEVAHA